MNVYYAKYSEKLILMSQFGSIYNSLQEIKFSILKLDWDITFGVPSWRYKPWTSKF